MPIEGGSGRGPVSAVAAEVEADKAAMKRKNSRSIKSGDSDGGGSTRSARSARGTRSCSSGSTLAADNLRAHDNAAKWQSRKLQKVDEDEPPRTGMNDVCPEEDRESMIGFCFALNIFAH